jgi:nicotinamidase-related amidase
MDREIKSSFILMSKKTSIATKNMAINKASNNHHEKMIKDGKCNLKGSKILRSHRVESNVRRALIVENMQNCFFNGGTMGFKNKGDEMAFLKKVNKLISLHEDDPEYQKASKTGRSKTDIMGNTDLGVDTGSRKKLYFDTIIFTQEGNPPDHWTFASHHYLRYPNQYDHFSGSSKDKKKTYKCRGHRCRKQTKVLLPEHALTDGSDRYKRGGKERIGIDFHPKLDVRSLFRPNEGIHESAFLKKPIYKNRGFIVFKGNSVGDSEGAFKNSLDKSTGLSDFLRCNRISSLFVCGMGRDNTITHTLNDAINLKFLKERVLVYDATLPLGIDIVKDKDVYKKSLSKNKYVSGLRSKGIKVVTYNNLERNVKMGQTIHSTEQPTGEIAKSLQGLEDLFSTSMKK